MGYSFENLTFENLTVRSEGNLLSDFQACRQLRHVKKKDLEKLCNDFFNRKNSWVWCSDAFAMAMNKYGYSCDVCGVVTDVPKDKDRIAGERCLANLDGRTKLMLCSTCSGRFRGFCTRQYGDASPSVYSPDYEKVMLAFIAWEYTNEYQYKCSDSKTKNRGAASHSSNWHKASYVQ